MRLIIGGMKTILATPVRASSTVAAVGTEVLAWFEAVDRRHGSNSFLSGRGTAYGR